MKRVFLAAAVMVAALAIPALAFPPPNMTRDESAVSVRNVSDAGAWITLYKFVSIAQIKKGLFAYCVEPGQTVSRVLPVELDQIRAEIKPGCNGHLLLDQSHRIELIGIAGGGLTPTHFKEFRGVVEGHHNGNYRFVEVRN